MKMLKGVLLFCLILLVSCNQASSLGQASVSAKSLELKQVGINGLVTLERTDDEAWEFIQWKNNAELYFLKREPEKTTIVLYHLHTGSQKVLYATTDIVSAAQYERSQQRFALHTSQTGTDSTLLIIDSDGNVLNKKTAQANDLYIALNPMNASTMVISSFNRDWSFNTEVWNYDTDEVMKVDTASPFVKWINASSLMYQNAEDNSLHVVEKEAHSDIPLQAAVKDFYIDAPNVALLLERESRLMIGIYKIVEGIFQEQAMIPWKGDSFFLPPLQFHPEKNQFFVMQNRMEQSMLHTYRLSDGESLQEVQLPMNHRLDVSPNGEWAIVHSYDQATIVRLRSSETKEIL
ncbi:hypothetical protein G4V62_00785 [Bacillaceae bacterium SIJ1]|uniref:YqgU-like beta propeller domain-containing protein n=1 Tax=Litoribacterium kuwaitense TaxID=1398745 RepID=UPI0013EDED49|nr:hypothetical protein [Litoribacterium kuwaitense]NGP43567.1 hypothetical protein [Litoribacterium kuwaitense]